MKKFVLSIFVAAGLMFTSCGGSCDLETAAGAAKCYCDAKDDKEKRGELENKIEKKIEEGKYTENELEAAANEIEGCEL